MGIGKRTGKVVKGAGNPGSTGSDAIGGSLSKNDHWYLQQGFGFGGQPGAAPIPATGHTASGGIISDYTDPTGQAYRSHTFNGSGTFTISTLSTTYPAHIEYLLIGGGGGSAVGESRGGGGGAGGLLTNVPGVTNNAGSPITAPTYPVTAKSYPITIGGGGSWSGPGAPMIAANGAAKGFDSIFDGPTGLVATGGGGGGSGAGSGGPTSYGGAGGSGGGGAGPNGGSPWPTGASNGGAGNSPPTSPAQGFPGGQGGMSEPSSRSRGAGGGGGATSFG